MKFINFNDNLNKWNVKTILEIVSKVDEYCQKNGIEDAELYTVEDNTWSDTENKRYDIEIRYKAKDRLMQQKLLILKGEILDGNEFHKRYNEFYSRSA